MDALRRLGLDDDLVAAFQRNEPSGSEPARVATEHRTAFDVYTSSGTVRAEITGRLRYAAAGVGDLPVVGDWVACTRIPGEDKALIHRVLPRRTKLSRRAPGRGPDTEQMLAANLDVAFVLVPLDRDVRARGIERYLTVCHDGGVEPVVVLTKADLVDDAQPAMREARRAAAGTSVVVASAVERRGLDDLVAALHPNRTAALLGPSGAGKSTLTNVLCGDDVHATQEVRSDGKGRHTTVRRELVPVPSGGALVDTPGMRELGLWDADEGVETVFADVVELLDGRCRFRDCTHRREPGCAIAAAVASGELDEDRWQAYQKQQREVAHLERRLDDRAARDAKKRWKEVAKAHRERMKLEPDRWR